MNHAIKFAAAMLIGICLAGCEPAPVVYSRPHKAIVSPPTRGQFALELKKVTAQFDADVSRLPGKTAEEHRQILLSLLDELTKILPLANGKNESPEFKNRLAVVKSARDTVEQPGIDRRRMEAVENQALQAAGPVLSDLAYLYLSDDAQFPPLLDAQADAITAAAASIGPMHDLDAANAFTAMRAVVDEISADYMARFVENAKH